MDESVSPQRTARAEHRRWPSWRIPTRRPAGVLVGLIVTVTISACASDTAGTDWTFAPAADQVSRTTSVQGGSPEPADAGPIQDEAERAQPLQPPAGIVIPRFVDPERADQPEAADAVPAPLQLGPGPTQVPATGAPVTVDPTATPSSNPTATPSAQATQPAALELPLVAEGSDFDADELTVDAGAAVHVTLENRDPIPHNFALYMTDAADEALFQGETFSGPGATRRYELVAPAEPGEYHFRCDVHPQLMTGTFIVE